MLHNVSMDFCIKKHGNVLKIHFKEKNSKNIDVIIFSNEAALYMIPLRTKSWIL